MHPAGTLHVDGFQYCNVTSPFVRAHILARHHRPVNILDNLLHHAAASLNAMLLDAFHASTFRLICYTGLHPHLPEFQTRLHAAVSMHGTTVDYEPQLVAPSLDHMAYSPHLPGYVKHVLCCFQTRAFSLL